MIRRPPRSPLFPTRRSSDLTSSPADEVVKEIKAAGGKAVSNHMDIATVEGGEGLINQAITEFGKPDILVNVAGILRDRMKIGRAHFWTPVTLASTMPSSSCK